MEGFEGEVGGGVGTSVEEEGGGWGGSWRGLGFGFADELRVSTSGMGWSGGGNGMEDDVSDCEEDI